MAAESPDAVFSCVEDDAGERSVAPPPLAADPTASVEVTETATPADVVDEATAVSIPRNILNVENGSMRIGGENRGVNIEDRRKNRMEPRKLLPGNGGVEMSNLFKDGDQCVGEHRPTERERQGEHSAGC